MDIEYDRRKSERTKASRGFDFDYAARIFQGRTVMYRDARRDYGEIRMIAIGKVDDQVYKVVFTDRGNVRRIISANRASRQERRLWQMSD